MSPAIAAPDAAAASSNTVPALQFREGLAFPLPVDFQKLSATELGRQAPDRDGALNWKLGGYRFEDTPLSTVEEFYAARASRAFWLADETADPGAELRRADLMAAMRAAWRHGLPELSPAAADLEERIFDAVSAGPIDAAEPGADAFSNEGASTNSSVSALERDLMAAFLDLAGKLRSGVISPGQFAGIYVTPEELDRAELFRRLAAGDRVTDLIEAQAPQDPGYRALMDAHLVLHEVTVGNGWGHVLEPGPSLEVGISGPEIVVLRSRLAELGDTSGVAADPAVFDQGLRADVIRFQLRHGLEPDGVVGPATRADLNVTAQERRGQVIVALERMRWRSRSPGPMHVWVNQADFSMQLMEEGQVRFETRAIVGSPEHPTPEFSDVMEHMVVNPSWNVPTSIAQNEILPELKKDPSYLEQNNMYRRKDGRIVQKPGPKNALGSVKFMFPNRHAIYLHDTPAKSLFSQSMRALSHGCIRLQDPHDLALTLLSLQTAEPERVFARALDSGRTDIIRLEAPVPVHLTYQTAWVGSSGSMQFRSDIYGRDSIILARLVAAGVQLPTGPEQIASNVASGESARLSSPDR
jgi:murein L,D-transpeptidase YcbB/YkuD